MRISEAQPCAGTIRPRCSCDSTAPRNAFECAERQVERRAFALAHALAQARVRVEVRAQARTLRRHVAAREARHPFPQPGVEHLELRARKVAAREAVEQQRAEIETLDGRGAPASLGDDADRRAMAARVAHHRVHAVERRVVAARAALQPLERLAPVQQRESYEAHGELAAGAARLRERQLLAHVGELAVLLLDPRGEALVVLVPAERRAEQLALDARHAGIERGGELGHRAFGLLHRPSARARTAARGARARNRRAPRDAGTGSTQAPWWASRSPSACAGVAARHGAMEFGRGDLGGEVPRRADPVGQVRPRAVVLVGARAGGIAEQRVVRAPARGRGVRPRATTRRRNVRR